MNIAVMQPYLFPYIGYFQLMRSVDTFVVYDDVQYIQRGWINRNRILNQGTDLLFTFSVKPSPRDAKINEREYSCQFGKEAQHFLKSLQYNYKKAPFFEPVYELIHKILSLSERNVAKLNQISLQMLAQHLSLTTRFICSSEIEGKSQELKGEDHILDIAAKLKATRYVNPIGGRALYAHEHFSQRGVSLFFLQSRPITYSQFGLEFVPWLSIVDVLMFNHPSVVGNFLDEFDLIE